VVPLESIHGIGHEQSMRTGQVVVRDPWIEMMDKMIPVTVRVHNVLLKPPELIAGRRELRSMTERHVFRYFGKIP